MKPCASILVIISFLLLLAPERPTVAHGLEFTSSDVADAAEGLTGHRAHMSDEIRLLAGTKLAGPALTLRIVRDDSASLMVEGLKVVKVLEEAPRGSVIVVSLDDEKSFAVFGTTIATLAQSRRLAGFVVDGAMRGLPAIKRMAFPTFARGTVSGSAGGHYRLAGVNVPIICGGIEVSPGDIIVGDEDGVAVAPKSKSSDILRKANELRREKEAILPLIRKYRSYTRALEERSRGMRRKSKARR